MRASGVRQIGGVVELLELAEPRALRADEILLDVRAGVRSATAASPRPRRSGRRQPPCARSWP